MTTARLKVLEQSLIKKQALFDQKLENHIATVKLANGQPLNDKRNGHKTLGKWDKQKEQLRKIEAEIEKTKMAIANEKLKISNVESANTRLPESIKIAVDNGVITQWRRHPNYFFVEGVDKARLIWDYKTQKLLCRYLGEVTDLEHRKKFVAVAKELDTAISSELAIK